MHITVLCVGKAHDKHLVDAINTYQQRLGKFVRLDWEYIPASSKDEESQRITKRLDGYVILLDEIGESFTSPQIAQKIESLQNDSVKNLTIVIGGAFGVSDDVRASADLVWSLSPLVFPHQLVRLILVEQLYRAYDILAGGQYHHS